MKSIGILRNFDAMGRIVIPMNMRRAIGMDNEASRLEVWQDGDRIILQKFEVSCRLCGSCENLTEVEYEKFLCKSCMKSVVQASKEQNP
jgi:AbrB family transcriptional regulator, transcriptional pleiotropic regulator of transition state genes